MDRKKQILNLIEEHGPFTTTQVTAELLLDRANASRHLNALVSEKRIFKAKVGRLVYYSKTGIVPPGASDTRPNSRKKEILNLLISRGPATTNEVALTLGLDIANTSRHLNSLAKSGDLCKFKRGREVCYSASSPKSINSTVANKPHYFCEEQFHERRCWRCGFLSEPDSLYCRMCGTILKRLRGRTIKTEVKQAVWRRDGGKCVICGSTENLHYDHIIPFSKGGANNIENIQVMCATCNMRKSDRIE